MNLVASSEITPAIRKWKPYPAYKDSGVGWLGKIPEHWQGKKLKYLFRVVNGSTPKSTDPEYWDGEIPWVTPEDLGKLSNGTIISTERCITEAGYQSCGTTLVPTGSLVLSTRAPIGHLAVAAVNLCTNQGCRSLIFKSASDRQFYFYQLLAAKSELQYLGQGSTFQELGKYKLEATMLVTPPSHEQHAIAAFLDRETAKIDALMAKKERLIELLQEKRSALITCAVTKGLDPNVPMKDSGIEWLGKIPAHWRIKRFRFLVESATQNGLHKAQEFYNDHGVPIFSMAEAFASPVIDSTAKDRVTLTEEEQRSYTLRKGDLLFARRSLVFEGSGKCSMVADLPEPHIFESSIIRVTPNRQLIEP
jgi:type I restriction enzyme S subunit